MQVSEVMNRSVASIDPNAMIRDAARQMRDQDVGALVVMEDDQPIGMVTDRDLVVRAIATERGFGVTAVRETMSEGVAACREDVSTEEAAKIMSDHKVRRLPVLDGDGRLVGVIGLADIARAEDPGTVAETVEHITEPSPNKPRAM